MKKLTALALLGLVAACASPKADMPRDRAPFGELPADLPVAPAVAPAGDITISTIAFGSCLHQDEAAPILARMAAEGADLTLFIGDNVYGDVEDWSDRSMPELVDAYRTLAGRADFRAVLRASPVMAAWDDHDYGRNDLGGGFALKEQAEEIFETFWNLPEDDIRLSRPGTHVARQFGPDGQSVQIIMLDTRFFRSDLTRTDERGMPGKERYLPSADERQTMLGEEQEAWLARVLAEPADYRILVSSVQVIAEGHGWEAWRTMPQARQRLYDMIAKAGADNLLVLSGDRHLGGLYRNDEAAPFPLYELTSSSLNLPQTRWREKDGVTTHEAGPKRLGLPIYEENYGVIEIDWENATVTMSLKGMEGQVLRTARIPLSPSPAQYRTPAEKVRDL